MAEMFEWSDYLVAAKEWQKDPRESHGRAAISRAYYAAFNHAKKYIERSGNDTLPKHGAAHEQVPEVLKQLRFPALASDLESLKRQRTWADYHGYTKPKLSEEVRTAITRAERIIGQLER
jgi:hypothetical protein